MVMLSGLMGFMLLGGIAFMPDVEPPITEEEEFEPDTPELEESAQPTDGPDLLRGRFLDDMIDGRGGDDQINGYDGDDTLMGGAGDDVLMTRIWNVIT
jgi:Ca2+-binding RTX toxin-like protein